MASHQVHQSSMLPPLAPSRTTRCWITQRAAEILIPWTHRKMHLFLEKDKHVIIRNLVKKKVTNSHSNGVVHVIKVPSQLEENPMFNLYK